MWRANSDLGFLFARTRTWLRPASVKRSRRISLREKPKSRSLTAGNQKLIVRPSSGPPQSPSLYQPDVVLGLGGGSNLDLSKAVALLVRYPAALSTYYGENNVPGPIAPVVAVPTTAGTGSEVSPVAVVADPERAMKVGIASRALIPKWAVVDPALTVSCPASVTAHSGMDALAHAIESFCARVRTDCSPHAIFVGKNPMSDVLATKAISAIAKFLPRAVAQPSDREARQEMALASLLAGMAFSSAGTAAVHALQYPVGEATHTPHGLGNAVFCPRS